MRTVLNSRKSLSIFTFSLFCAFLFLAQRSVGQTPVIVSFTPVSARAGDTITITGTNFNTNPANNSVFFGPVKAGVTVATSTSLTVIVPVGATYDHIRVINTANSLQGQSLAFFLPVFNSNQSGIGVTDLANNVGFDTGVLPYSIATGDLDGDGKPDVVVANSNANTVSILRNTGNSGVINASSFAAKVDFAVASRPYSIAIADIDGDGKLDIITANNGTGTVSILRNTGSNGAINLSSFATKTDFTTGTINGYPTPMAIGDVDGDGKPDVVVGSYAGYASVMRNTSSVGTISLAGKVDFGLPMNPYSMAISDIDGDGKRDVITATTNGVDSAVYILRNTGNSGTINTSSLAATVGFKTGTRPYSMVIGDIDGDGKPDIVTANNGPNASISILRNTSTSGAINGSSFAAKVNFKADIVSGYPTSVALGDLDGDGKPDIAVSNWAGLFSIFRNTSSLGIVSLAEKVNFGLPMNPYSIAIADMDGDRVSDIINATSNGIGNAVYVARNQSATTPYLSAIANQSICFDNAMHTINLSGIGPGTGGSNATLSVSSSDNSIISGLSVSAVNGGTSIFSYSPANPTGGTVIITVTVKDNGGTANGRIDTFNRTFTITVNPLPDVPTIVSDIGSDISLGTIAQLTAVGGGTTYAWATSAGIIAGQNTAVLRVRPLINTTYTVTTTNASGCTAVQSFKVNVIRDYKTLDVLNAITPNGDGKNDTWMIRNIDAYPDNTVKIFDRAGRLVYTKKGYNNDWDGSYNGSPLQQDTYYYIVDFGSAIGSLKGFISIVR